jgi:hypothetical protein
MFARVAVFNGLLMNVLLCAVLGVALVAGADASLEDVMLVSVVVAAIALIPAASSVFRRLRALDRTRVVLRNPIEPATWMSRKSTSTSNWGASASLLVTVPSTQPDFLTR